MSALYCMDFPEEAGKELEHQERLLKAIVIYCEGVRADFPETKVWMDNIIALATSPVP